MGHLPLLKFRRTEEQCGGLGIFEAVETDPCVRNPSGRQGHGEVQTRDKSAVSPSDMVRLCEEIHVTMGGEVINMGRRVLAAGWSFGDTTECTGRQMSVGIEDVKDIIADVLEGVGYIGWYSKQNLFIFFYNLFFSFRPATPAMPCSVEGVV